MEFEQPDEYQLQYNQNFSQIDYQHASSGFIAKFEEISDKRRLYVKPEEEYPIGSHSMCSIQLSSNCEEYIGLIQITPKGNAFIVPKGSIQFFVNDQPIASITRLNNFDRIKFYDIELKYVTFYSDIIFKKNESFQWAVDEMCIYLTRKYFDKHQNNNELMKITQQMIRHQQSYQQLFHYLLSAEKSFENTDEMRIEAGIMKQIISQLMSVCICDIGNRILENESRMLMSLGRIKQSATRKINFDEMEDEEDPFEKFKRESILRKSLDNNSRTNSTNDTNNSNNNGINGSNQ